MALVPVLVGFLLAASPAPLAGNGACWGGGQNDPSSPHVSCTEITETLVTRLHFASKDQVLQAMGVPGIRQDENHWHFRSNAHRGGRGSGAINFTFGADGKVAAIIGEVDRDPHDIVFSWNSAGGGCSDFPNRFPRCSD